MIKIAAVVAHFDVSNNFDPTFLLILKCLKNVCSTVIVVTTSVVDVSLIPERVVVIQRPNVGYDFYSYRVGLDRLSLTNNHDRVFLVNSSFLVLDPEKFVNTLSKMILKSLTFDITSLTESYQLTHHFQSYLLLLTSKVFNSSWFAEWKGSIAPKNSKMESIIAYELGFSQKILSLEIPVTATFSPSAAEKESAENRWFDWQNTSNTVTIDKNYNPVHFSAEAIANHHGIIKTELIRNNPHSLDMAWVKKYSSSKILWNDVCNVVERSKKVYKASDDGLTILSVENSSEPSYRLICSSPLARPGVRIAVVVHLFYVELLDEICDLLKSIIEPFDLFITTPFEGLVPVIFDRCSLVTRSVSIVLIENRGRDMAPFMALHRSRILDKYLAVLKLHSKQSKYSEQGTTWRKGLYNELCGNYRTVQQVISIFLDEKCGLVGPHNFYLKNEHFWGGNYDRVKILLDSIGINYQGNRVPLGFFGGSMFWFNPKALLALHDIPSELLSYEDEDGQRDATLAHAFERIFSNISQQAGYKSTSTKLNGKDIHDFVADDNTVPVLVIPKSQ